MGSRLILSFSIVEDVNDTLVLEYDSVDYDVVIPAGTYWWSCDGEADDFADVLTTAINTALAVPGGAFTVMVRGVDGSPVTSHAPGRVVMTDGYTEDWTWKTADGDFTFDARIIGEIPGAAASAAAPVKTSPHVHRYGWYPQISAVRDTSHRVTDAQVTWRSDRRRSGTVWGSEDGWGVIELEWDVVHAPLIRIDAATASSRTDPLLLTAGDTQCAWERFALDAARNWDHAWRYYADADDETSYLGPYTFARGEVWTDPMSACQLRSAAGELWSVQIVGTEAVA